jgi:DNA-binding CsgD family transcriptional regulator
LSGILPTGRTHTVDTHKQHLMDKLSIRGIADLTKYAISNESIHL